MLTVSACVFTSEESSNFGFIELGVPSLEVTPFSGKPSQAINNIWVYVDDQALGVYPIPSKVPVEIKKDVANFKIRAGVKPNGNSSASIEYPFFDEILLSTPLEAYETKPILLAFKYKTETVFDINEDFEVGNTFTTDVDGNDKTLLKREKISSPFGDYAGHIELTSENNAIEVTHFTSFSNAKNKKGSVFLEFDYKCDDNFFVGTILQKGNTLIKAYKILVTSSNEWNRFYVDLTEEISKSDVETYKVVFSSTLTNGRSTSSVFLDNLKLIHF